MKDIIIASFYKFIPLNDFESLRDPILTKMHETGIKGTIILAHEGVNGGFAGSREQMTVFYHYLRSDSRFADLHFKETYDSKNPFDKAKVKLRKEIVTMGVQKVDPSYNAGTYLNPEEWHQFIQDPDVILLDTRNDYEYELGTFKNAINPDIENFREFPDYVQRNLIDKKDKKIAMFCTGGIRCEKTTAYMKELGFQHVYQLHDGILNYLESIPENESLWEGKCFVFDDRVAVDQKLDRVYPQLPQDYKYEREQK
ncbi:TPA: rhodanese-related sulfurtransferase [Legionella pneumophila]